MKQAILTFTLIFSAIFPSLAQNTPIDLVKKARILVKDSIELVESKKDLIQETKALIRDVQGLSKTKKAARFLNQNAKFQIGLTFQSFKFTNYKSVEGEGRTKLVEASNFNAFAMGLTFRKKLNEHFSLKSELIYSIQNEKSIFSTASSTDFDGKRSFYYNGKTKIEYGQLKIPVLADYRLKLDSKNTWSLHSYLGGQITFLANYKITERKYYVDNRDAFDINNAELNHEWINTSGYVDEIFVERNTEGVTKYTSRLPHKLYIFKRFMFGLVGGLEIEKKLSPNFALGFGLRYEYNLSITENKDYGAQIGEEYSNQRRIGMTFSLLKTIH